MAAVGDHDDGVHGLFGGFLGGAVEGGGQIGGTGGGVVVGAQDLAPIVARQGQNLGGKGITLDVGMIGDVLEPGVLRGVQPAGHLVISRQLGFPGQSGLVLAGGVLFVGGGEQLGLALDALQWRR